MTVSREILRFFDDSKTELLLYSMFSALMVFRTFDWLVVVIFDHAIIKNLFIQKPPHGNPLSNLSPLIGKYPHYKKGLAIFPSLCRDVTYQTLPGQE